MRRVVALAEACEEDMAEVYLGGCSHREDEKAVHDRELAGLRLQQSLTALQARTHETYVNPVVSIQDGGVGSLSSQHEWCPDGDLEWPFQWKEQDALTLVRRLLSIVSFLHANRVVHHDLKRDNFLRSSGDLNRVQVCDFGTARRYSDDAELATQCQADLRALGLLLMELATRDGGNLNLTEEWAKCQPADAAQFVGSVRANGLCYKRGSADGQRMNEDCRQWRFELPWFEALLVRLLGTSASAEVAALDAARVGLPSLAWTPHWAATVVPTA